MIKTPRVDHARAIADIVTDVGKAGVSAYCSESQWRAEARGFPELLHVP